MAGDMTALLDRIAHRRALARWARLAETAEAGALAPAEARRQRGRAEVLRRQIDRLIAAADRVLLADLPGAAPARPPGADWVWRPAPWAGPLPAGGAAAVPQRLEIGGGVTLFHDAPGGEVTLRQLRAAAAGDPAPFALAVDALGFDGSFLSLAIDLPEEGRSGLTARHVAGLSALVEMEQPVEAFARLNLRHGPNTEQLVAAFGPGAAEVEFDLATTRLGRRRVEAAWLDLIFDRPAWNRIVIRDATLFRRPRAEP